MATLSLVRVPTLGHPVLELGSAEMGWCQFGFSGMKPGSGTGHPVSMVAQFRNCVNGEITSSPVPALDRPVPALGAPFWHGADLGMWVFQFRNWTTSAGTGTGQNGVQHI